MKILALAVLVAIVLGGLIGTLLVRDPGYVLVAYADTVLETSLWVALLLLVGLYLLVRGISFVMRKLIQGHARSASAPRAAYGRSASAAPATGPG